MQRINAQIAAFHVLTSNLIESKDVKKRIRQRRWFLCRMDDTEYFLNRLGEGLNAK